MPATATIGGAHAAGAVGVAAWPPLTVNPAVVQPLASAVTAASAPVGVTVQGDSTGNQTTEWVYLTAAWLAGYAPGLTNVYRLWNDTNQAYDFPVTLSTASGGRRGIVSTGATTDKFVTIPDSAATSISGDLDVAVLVTVPGYAAASNGHALCSKFGGGGSRGWRFELTATGYPLFSYSTDGTTYTDITCGVAAPASIATTPTWLRVKFDADNGASGNDVVFLHSADGVTWTQLGPTKTTAGTVTQYDNSIATQLCGRGGAAPASGLTVTYSALVVRNGIDGPAVIDLDLGDYTSGSTFTDLCGNTCTVAGTTGSISGGYNLTWWNASTSGQTVSYSTDGTRFGKQTPGRGHLSFINYGHNQSGTTLGTTVDPLVDLLTAKYPAGGVVVVAQNPRMSPASGVADHAARGRDLMAYAVTNGIGAVNVYKAIADVGINSTYIDAGGIHPTDAGQVVWAETVEDYLANRVS